jgi:hypothetical protein
LVIVFLQGLNAEGVIALVDDQAYGWPARDDVTAITGLPIWPDRPAGTLLGSMAFQCSIDFGVRKRESRDLPRRSESKR